MSYDNYTKNKTRVEYLFKSYIDLNTKQSRHLLRYGKIYECHCRCCEDLYFEHINVIIERMYCCKCGSCRLEIFDSRRGYDNQD